jgi:hypothetical protein
MDPRSDQDLSDRFRQVVWQGMDLCRACGQGPPGDEIGRGLGVMFPIVQKRGKRHGLILLHLVFNCSIL